MYWTKVHKLTILISFDKSDSIDYIYFVHEKKYL
jgi:hypothetical protein